MTKNRAHIIPDPKTGAPAFAVVPCDAYEALLAAAEDREDMAALARNDREGLGELVPHEVMLRLANGESPVRVWREHRGMTQAALAIAANVPQASISEIENGTRGGSVATLQRIARALAVDLEDVVRQEGSD